MSADNNNNISNNNNNNNQPAEPYTPSGDPSLWCEDVGQMSVLPPSLFSVDGLEEGTIVGFEDLEQQEQQEQHQQAAQQQKKQAQVLLPPPPPLPLPPQAASRENCFSVFANGEQTAFTLSFAMQFSKKVQEYGPLSMSAYLRLISKGEIKEEQQEEIENALNCTLQDLGYRFKLCFGPACAGIITPEEAVVKEKIKNM